MDAKMSSVDKKNVDDLEIETGEKAGDGGAAHAPARERHHGAHLHVLLQGENCGFSLIFGQVAYQLVVRRRFLGASEKLYIYIGGTLARG